MNKYYVIFSNADKADTTRKKYSLTERCGLFIDADNEPGKAIP